MRVKWIRILLLLVLSLGILTSCGKKEEEEEEQDTTVIPNAYFIGSESITAVQAEKGVYLSKLTTEEDGGFVYTYNGFAAVGESVQAYVEMLMAEEQGFQVVDGETFRSANQPDYTVAEGTVSLSKDAENEKITVVRLDWSADQCIASISIEDAPVIEEPEPTTKKNAAGLSHVGAIDYLKELSPAVLGLEGGSMDEYNVYITNGFIYVDGQACLRVEIYSDLNDTNTNEYQGSYFMSGNAEHIYRLDEDGMVVEMDQNQ